MTRARLLLLVAAVGLAARLACVFVIVPRFERTSHLAPDPDRYVELAGGLLDRGALGFDPPDASPTTLRGPGFPAWLAVGMLAERSMRWLSLWASLPGLVAAMAVALLLRRSHGTVAALAGGLIAAAHPLPCFMSARLLSDETYGACVFLGSVAWILATRAAQRRSQLAWGLAAGVSLAAASLTRASALGVVALLAITTFAKSPRSRPVALMTTLVVAIPVAGWSLRTTALAGAPTFVESLAGYNFWLGESAFRSGLAPGFAESRRRAHELMADEGGTPETASPSFRYTALTPARAHAFDETLRRSAVAAVRRHPLRYGERIAAGALWFWIRAESLRSTLLYAVVALPIVALALAGLSRATALPAWIVLLHLASYAAIYPMARYSVGVYPLLAYLAGIGVATLARRRERRRGLPETG